jgi:ectoine hydroxylase-related dioxygenase (phytanoyl-CoA dioxygenase family)
MDLHPFLVSNELLGQPEALRARAATDGYLYFRRLVPVEALTEVRDDILALCREAGWLAPDSDFEQPRANLAAKCIEGEPRFMEVYDRLMRLESFHTLAHHPAILTALRALFGEEVLVHPRNIARLVFPQTNEFTTPPHQDYVHIQGTEETWTTWFPLLDCPRELGGLVVLSGSHEGGLQPTHAAKGAGGLGVATDLLPYEWHGGDFAAGDVLFFKSLTVHKALPNTTPDRLRLSVDFRYQPVSHPVVPASLEPHYGRLSWEQVYEGWRSPEFQYYWRRLPLRLVEWTPRYHAPIFAAPESEAAGAM